MSNVLKAEDVSDPKYVAMSDQEVADSYNAKTETRTRTAINSGTLHEQVDRPEFDALPAGKKEAVRELYSLGSFAVQPGSKAREVLDDAFPAGSKTRTSLLAALT